MGVLIALASAAVHYLVAPPTGGPDSIVRYVDELGPVWPGLFGGAGLVLVVALLTSRFRYGAHVLAAGCLSGYAVALWGTALLSGSTRGVVTAGLATALAVHALLLAAVYSRGGAGWTQR
ncbi:hypothetical protein GCM10027597_01190 [Saccharopolyspora tripterygii]